jgi:uncharacterized surface protein with fasciclin (FAS1) repeats
MTRNALLILLTGIIFISFGCQRDFEEEDQYKRPSWLAGKIFTQIEAQPELSTFARCIKLIGLDSVINVTGTYTVFAPNNDAFVLYFEKHPEYKSVEDIPKNELERIVKFHILKNPWSKEQLKQLDVEGWIDTTQETNNKPKGFKRETLLREPDTQYGVKREQIENYVSIVDTLNSAWRRKIYTDGNKFASIFYKEFFDIYNLKTQDYNFYFGRSFEKSSDVFYMEGRIVKENVFAENGFIHIIDRVVEPAQNAFQILKTSKNNSYTKFLEIVNNFPLFYFNKPKTDAQPGASTGAIVDSLFDVRYDLTFDVLNENTRPPRSGYFTGNPTIRYQNGLVAPTNAALDVFVNEYFGGNWASLKNAPSFVRQIIVESHMSSSPIFPSHFEKGFLNGMDDLMKIDQSTIVQQQFGSNCSFIGVNKALIPRPFKSVTGPVFLNSNYESSLYAIALAGLVKTLTSDQVKYSLFVEPDDSCKQDSSLLFIRSLINGYYNYQFLVIQKESKTKRSLLIPSDLRALFLNHIGIGTPKGNARKEFIRTLGGNFIIFNNDNNTVSGTSQTYAGYNGTRAFNNPIEKESNNADNGNTYKIAHWFSFSSPLLYIKISTTPELSKFHALLKKAGLADDKNSKYTFLTESENYTVFAPNNNAFTLYNADTLSVAQLKKFLMTHFIQGSFIFTDGNNLPNYYETTRIDESSSQYSTVFSKIYIEPGVNYINIKDKSGNNYLTVNESATANMITGRNLSTGTPAYQEYNSTGVVHIVDKVLLINDLDRK